MLTPEIKDFIFSDLDKNYNFIHVTDKFSAVGIFKRGFNFANPLYKTADMVLENHDWIEFWWQQRKFYGDQIIVMSISKLLFEYCSNICKHEFDGKINPFQLLNTNKILHFIDGEAQLNLAKNFIKGYIDLEENHIYKNEHFDPYLFKQTEVNLKKYKDFINQQ
jgi:hypothetical protein